MRYGTFTKALVRSAALACVAFAAASCTRVSDSGGAGAAGSASTASGRNASARPHELRVVLQGDVSNLNPLLSVETQAFYMADLTMAWLLRYDAKNRAEPELATSVPTQANGGISADGKTITYHLRHDARWSDGKPFTSADVAFTTRVILDPKTNVQSRSGWDKIAKVETPDPYTVIFRMKSVFSPFVTQTFTTGAANPSILPEHLLAHTANINTDPYNTLPVGIGPFKFTKWARADHIEMVADPLYFRGKPKLAKITFQIVPNRDTIVNEMQTGDVDLWPLAAPAYYSRLLALPHVHVLRGPSFIFGHIDFNTTHRVVADPVVRRALLLAWNRRLQLEKVAHGIGILQDSPISPSNPYFDPAIGFTAVNPAKANALLDADGWKRGADGVRAKNGVRLDIDLASNTGSPDTDERLELLRQDWKAIGATFTRKNYDPNQLFASAQENGVIQTGRFDAVIFAWNPGISGDLTNLYGCNQFPPAGQNDIHWCNARANAAMQDFIATFDDARKKRDVFIVQEELSRDVPTIVSAVQENLFAHNDTLKNFHPNQVSFFDNFMDVDI